MGQQCVNTPWQETNPKNYKPTLGLPWTESGRISGWKGLGRDRRGDGK